MLLPAVQEVRESARRTQCLNRLRQIGLATAMFHDSQKAFPPARLYPKKDALPPLNLGNDEPSWLVRILPYLEQQNFYQEWDLSESFSSHPKNIAGQALASYICPSRRNLSNAKAPDQIQDVYVTASCGCGGWFKIEVVGGATGDFAGNHGDLSPGSIGSATDYYYGGNGTGVIISSQARQRSEGNLTWIDRIDHASITDGSSNTILAGELQVVPDNLNTVPFNGPIYNGEDLAAFSRVGGPGVPLLSARQTPNTSVLGFGSWHPGTCNFVFADGSTTAISNSVDTVTLGQMCNRRDGEVIAN
ncbi:MAG: DUF1559 domain-containing protein [Mariniblastus sp.]